MFLFSFIIMFLYCVAYPDIAIVYEQYKIMKFVEGMLLDNLLLTYKHTVSK